MTHKTITGFKPLKIGLVGDFMLDKYIYGEVSRISPEAPVPIIQQKKEELRLGGAGNVAAAIAALDCKVVCFGIIGNDAEGDQIKYLLSRIDIEDKLIKAPKPTTQKTRLVGLASHRHAQQLLRLDRESTDSIEPKDKQKIIENLEWHIDEFDAIAVQDYYKGVIDQELCQKVIQLAKLVDIPVIIDPASVTFPYHYRGYSGATLITPNRFEAASISSESSVEEAAKFIAHIYGIDSVLITMDKDGSYLYIDGETHGKHIPTREQEVYDVTGAGDEVLAMVTIALGNGCDLHTAAELANIAGSLEVQHFGVKAITKDEIINEIEAYNNNSNKSISLEALRSEVGRLRKEGKKIVFINGCFDLIHRGHIELLQSAKKHGDKLIVALNSDKSIAVLKGPGRPILDLNNRVAIINAMKCVDYIVTFDDPTPMSLISMIKPDVLVKGADTDRIVGQEIVERNGGKIIKVPEWQNERTMQIIQKIQTSVS